MLRNPAPDSKNATHLALRALCSCVLTHLLVVHLGEAAQLTDPGAIPALAKPQGDQFSASEKLDFHTDAFTGRFSYRVPIELAPARGGSAPSVALEYNSANKNGWCGVGWDLSLGHIERDTRHGLQVAGGYLDSAGFTFVAVGQCGRLINVGGSSYAPQIDTALLKFDYTNGWWRVRDKSGRTYNFGETDNSRVTTSYGTFRWGLSSIRDANGNRTTLTYTNLNGNTYLDRIDYNGNDNLPAVATACSVVFDLESTDRADVISSSISGAEIQTKRRLLNIRAFSQDQLVRRYTLQYLESPSTGRSLLQKVTEYGSDNVTPLPPRTFSYQAQAASFNAESDWEITSQTSLGDDYGTSPGTPDAQLVDINGDGLPDWVVRPRTPPYSNFNVQLNTGSGFTYSPGSWSPVKNETDSPGADWNNLESANCHFLDINGDLLPDRVMRQYHPGYSSFKLQLNTGTGFNSSVTSWDGIASQNTSYFADTLNVPFATTADGIASLAVLADLNGDGLLDRVMLSSTSGQFDVQLNRNGSFGGVIPWANVASATGSGMTIPAYYSPRARNNSTVFSELIDLNGDGLPDRIIAGGVQLNYGTWGLGSISSWGLSSSEYPGAVNTTDGAYTTALVDINGDGLPDRVTLNGNSFDVRFNTGRGFKSTTKSWLNVSAMNHSGNGWNAPHAWDANGTRAIFADVNGDGLPDRVVRYHHVADPYDYLAVQLNSGPFPDLLSSVSNGIGGAVLVAYKPSTAYNNSDGTRPRLPFPLYTVSTVTNVDGRGSVAGTAYDYAGGYYDTCNREFRGFAWVRVSDPLGAYTDTYFHQGGGTNGTPLGEFQDDLAKAGMAYRTEVFGSDDKLYHRTLQKVNEVTLHTNGVYFPFTQQTITLNYEGNNAYRATAKGYAYAVSANNLAGSTGNLLWETNYSEVSSVNLSTHAFSNNVTGAPPPVYRQYTYAAITSNPDILDRPATVTVSTDTSGASVLQQTTNQYYPINGNLRLKAERICPDSYAVATFNYDAYGNLTSTTDAAGVVTTTDYDATSATSPIRSYVGSPTDRLITYTQYDPRSGQLLASTNPAGLVTGNSYDVFFRLTNSAISTVPNGQASLWRVRYEYRLGGMSAAGVSTNYVRILHNDPADAANGQHETYTYFDGLGRPIQARDEAESGQYRVSDMFYDNRGSPVLQEYPLFQTGSAFSKPSGTRTNVYTRFDAIGRAWRTDPFASASANSFGNWNGANPTILTGDTGSPVGPTSLAFKEGTNPWVLVATNALNKVRKFYLDAYGRTNLIVEVTAQGNYSNHLAYDLVGNLTNLTDSAGNQSSFYYNNLGQKIAQADQDLGFWQFARDAAGRLKTQTDARGQQIKFSYSDPAGRPTRREGWNSANQLVSLATYAYDSNGGDNQYTVFPGQLFQVTDDEGWQKFSYDVRGRVLKSVRYLSKNGQTYTTLHTHDDADRLSSTTYPNSGPTVTNVYDLGGNLSKVQRVDGGGSPIVYYSAQGFDELARLTGITFGNNAASTFGYYKTSRRLNQVITTIPGGIQVQNLTNRYDAFGNILAIQDNVPAHTGPASATLTNAVYDDLNRLVSAGWTGYGLKGYVYDKVGNILMNSEFGAGAYNYYANRAHAVKGANGAWYTYDQNGNIVLRSGQRLDYDVNNRLSRVASTGGMVTTFGYGAGGERLWEQSGTNSLQVWIGDIYEERGGKVLYHISAAGRRICTFEPAAGKATGYNPVTHEFYYEHPDFLGSSSVLTERNGTLVQHYEYSAFGQSRYTQSTSAFPVSRRYTGQVFDEDTGLYYFNFRYYDPQLGRFVQPDDIIPDLSNPQSYNRYAYVLNNPLRYIDPTGHAGKEVADWWSARVDTAAEFYSAGSSHWIWNGTVGTVNSVVGAVADPLRLGTSAGTVSGSLNATAGQIAIATVQEGSRALSIVPVGAAIGKGAGTLANSLSGGITRKAAGEVASTLAAKGGINYGPLDSLGRPTGVSATITEDMLGTGTRANQSIIPPGFQGGAAGQARGHLLGAQLGGSGDEVRNLVTILQNPANTPVMRGFENAAAAAVRGGETLNYSAVPIYQGVNAVPRGITVISSGSGGFQQGVTILNPIH